MTPTETPEVAAVVRGLTEAQRRLLLHLAEGGWFLAALHRPADYERNSVLFSESLGIVVGRDGQAATDYRRVRSSTAAALYLQDLADHAPGASGYRRFEITDFGRLVSAALTNGGNDGE